VCVCVRERERERERERSSDYENFVNELKSSRWTFIGEKPSKLPTKIPASRYVHNCECCKWGQQNDCKQFAKDTRSSRKQAEHRTRSSRKQT
jgi:hypothetical protein